MAYGLLIKNDDGDVSSPGSVEEVICVGGVDRSGSIWAGSSQGDNNGRILPLPPIMPRGDPDKKPELTGPGEDVPILIPLNLVEDGFVFDSGSDGSTTIVETIKIKTPKLIDKRLFDKVQKLYF